MDEEVQKPEPKISIVVGIFVIIVCIVMDIIGLIPGADDLEEVPAVILTALSAFLGIGPAMVILEILVDFLKAIPVVQELPLWTACWIVVWIFENHPSKLTQPIQKIVDSAAIAEGDAEALGEESTAIEGEVAAEAASAEESAQITADRKNLTEEGSSGPQQNSSNGSTEEDGEAENKENRNDIELGAERNPEEEAADADFGSPEASYNPPDDEEEEDEQPNNKVIDIKTRKPPTPPRSGIIRDEDSQRAA